MLKALSESRGAIRTTFDEASLALGSNLWQLAQEGPEQQINQTEWTQPLLLAAGVAVFRAWLSAGGARPQFLAGHSLGEYTALVCADALALADAIKLVQLRGQAMQESVPAGSGAMAAVLNAELDVVEAACAAAAQGQVVSPANLNSPGQIVIAGDSEAVDRTIAELQARGIKRVMKLNVSVPSHCALMRPAALRLEKALDQIEFHAPQIPVLQNVDARPRQKSSEIKSALVKQLYAPVQWIDTVRVLRAQGVNRVYECGPGKVLAGLCKRIDGELEILNLGEPDSFNAALEMSK
jgi:[acyl-carrier-protein] S-malonyltransferase